MINITQADYAQEVEQSTIPVVIDFYAEWCGPCKGMAPGFEALSKEFEGKIKFVKVDIDADFELARTFGVRGVPTLAFRRNGETQSMKVGAQSVETLREWLNASLVA